MHGIGLDIPLQEWFDFKIPRTQLPKNYIKRILAPSAEQMPKPNAKMVWLGPEPTRSKKYLLFSLGKEEVELVVSGKLGAWLVETLPKFSLGSEKTGIFAEFETAFSNAGLGDFENFWEGEIATELREMGLLVI
jgi:hypothetical protein